MTRPRARGTTAQRGLAGQHQPTRVRALTALQDGDPCFRCQLAGIYHPMYQALVTWTRGKPTSPWLDLDDYPGRMYGGPQTKRLSYRACNRRAGQRQTTAILNARNGARRGNRKRTPSPSFTTSRRW